MPREALCVVHTYEYINTLGMHMHVCDKEYKDKWSGVVAGALWYAHT